MPKQLKKFEFSAAAGESTYEWNKLLNGYPWQMEAGTDYTCKTETFLTLARNQAALRGQTLKTQKVEGGVVICTEGEPDAARGDAYRAKLSEQGKARRAAARAAKNGSAATEKTADASAE